MVEHLLVFAEREVADAVADGLERHGYVVRVLRETLAGEDDADGAQWLVHLVDERDLDPAHARAERVRLADLAHDNDGWYDDSNDDSNDDGEDRDDDGSGARCPDPVREGSAAPGP
ncbi:MAG: ribonuclease E inhibitor RraB [Actinomycetota bacterium]|nr:ribonuclease E inhibitor RraB [Actinomycetota bacterium]